MGKGGRPRFDPIPHRLGTFQLARKGPAQHVAMKLGPAIIVVGHGEAAQAQTLYDQPHRLRQAEPVLAIAADHPAKSDARTWPGALDGGIEMIATDIVEIGGK